MNKIWIIEDDASLARLISENLTKWAILAKQRRILISWTKSF